MPAQRALIPFETCQPTNVPQLAGEPVCTIPAVVVITAIYSYDQGTNVIRVDDVVCADHAADRICELLSWSCDAVQSWHARSLQARTVVPVPTHAERSQVGA